MSTPTTATGRTTAPAAGTSPATAPRRAPTRRGVLANMPAMARLALRLARVRIVVWIVGIVALIVITALSTEALYPTPESLAQAAQLMNENVAGIVFQGPPQALDTLGGQIAFQTGAFGLIVVGLMSVFLLGYLTRAEEENGRTELLLATTVGRNAPLAAALVIVTAVNVVVALAIGLGMLPVGLPLAGTVAYALSFLTIGLVSMGVAAVTAQVTENTRVVYGASGAVLAVAFLLRAVGDIGDGRLSWLSPIGWSQKLRPFAGEAWWVLAVPAVATVLLVVVAWALAGHRDVGAGLVAPRPGPPSGSARLGTPFGLALRLQRGSVLWWTVGVALTGTAYGGIANDVDEFIQDSPDMAEIIARFGGASLLDSFFATSALMLALVGSGFAVQAVLRLHAEETAGRAEPILATRVPRWRWLASHLAVAVGGSVLVTAGGGLGVGVTFSLITGDTAAIPRLLGASLAFLPAVWVLAGLALALFGLVPRLSLAAWAVYALAFVVGLLADLLRLPDWARDLSPFEHVPQLPARPFEALPLVLLLAVAVALAAAGVVGFRRRDTAP